MAELVKEKLKTCYISAPGDFSLVPLKQILHDRGISVMNPEAAYSEIPAPEAVMSYLATADLVIGILSRERRSDWTLFELGAAWANKRQILLVAPPSGTMTPPPGLEGVLVVRANPSNMDAVAFALDQRLSAPLTPRSKIPPRRSSAVGEDVRMLEISLNAALRLGDESVLMDVVSEILRDAKLDGVVSEAPTSNRAAKADFAVWVDELADTIGNPLLIEVKKSLPSGILLREAAARFSKTVTESGTRFGLLLYGNGPEAKVVNRSLPFNVLALPIADLLKGLHTRSFASLVKNLRNQRMHGVDS